MKSFANTKQIDTPLHLKTYIASRFLSVENDDKVNDKAWKMKNKSNW